MVYRRKRGDTNRDEIPDQVKEKYRSFHRYRNERVTFFDQLKIQYQDDDVP